MAHCTQETIYIETSGGGYTFELLHDKIRITWIDTHKKETKVIVFFADSAEGWELFAGLFKRARNRSYIIGNNLELNDFFSDLITTGPSK